MSLLPLVQDQISKQDKVAIKFSSPTCGPCKVMQPFFDKLSNDYPDFYYMNLEISDEDTDLSDYVKSTYSITTVPTFIVLDKGKEVSRVVGAKPYSQLVQGLGLDSTLSEPIKDDQVTTTSS